MAQSFSKASLEQAPALSLVDIHRGFAQGQERLTVLDGASLKLRRGEIVALVGPSGAGKSTLLQIAGLLERPSSGEVLISGRACGELPDVLRTTLRRRRIGRRRGLRFIPVHSGCGGEHSCQYSHLQDHHPAP